MKEYGRDWFRAFKNLIFPLKRCIGCGGAAKAEEAGLCLSCRRLFLRENDALAQCAFCPAFVPPGTHCCPDCRGSGKKDFDAGTALFPYQGEIRRVIHEFKYQGKVSWARFLGPLMAQKVMGDVRFREAALIIPVPLHDNRMKKRGYNQSALLAREMAPICALPAAEGILLRIRDTPSQTGLSRQARLDNLARAFSIKDPCLLKGETILLVDDIYTTGTTVNMCARILRDGGAKRVFVVTCAAGKRF